jgi:hypothetical protein
MEWLGLVEISKRSLELCYVSRTHLHEMFEKLYEFVYLVEYLDNFVEEKIDQKSAMSFDFRQISLIPSSLLKTDI